MYSEPKQNDRWDVTDRIARIIHYIDTKQTPNCASFTVLERYNLNKQST